MIGKNFKEKTLVRLEKITFSQLKKGKEVTANRPNLRIEGREAAKKKKVN